MKLKSVRLFGFKTFAKSNELLFGPGMTAVVGPNGSGKSNLVDALRWVLGERQAREVRGGTMDDVIFAGGGRQGTTSVAGKMNVAEVELVLDNSDETIPVPYTDVSIRRRIVRGGETEYFLCGKRVRRMDIDELLNATGLMVHGYSIIAQHDVDAIIYASPNERKQLIEEAAGIRLYAGVLQRGSVILEDTSRRIAAATSLLDELKPQWDRLEEQATATLRERELSSRINELQGDRDRAEWRAAKSRVADLGRKRTAAERECMTRKTTLGTVEARFAELQTKSASLYEADAHASDAIGVLRSAYSAAQHRLATAKDQVRDARLRWERLLHQREDGRGEQARAMHEAKALEERLSHAEGELQVAKSEHDDLRSKLDAARGREQELRRTVREAENAYMALQKEWHEVETAEARHEAELLQVRDSCERTAEDIAKRTARLQALREDDTAALREVQRLEQAVEEAQASLASCIGMRDASRTALEEAQRVAGAAAKVLAITESSLAAAESALHVIVRSQDHGAVGVHGATRLFEHIEVHDASWRSAVEAVLGNELFAYCVPSVFAWEGSDTTGEGGYILWERSGTMKPGTSPHHPTKMHLSDVVTTSDPELSYVVHVLCDGIVCCSTLNEARNIVADGSYRAVLPDGTLLEKHHCIVPGTTTDVLRLQDEIRNLEMVRKEHSDAVDASRVVEQQAESAMASIRSEVTDREGTFQELKQARAAALEHRKRTLQALADEELACQARRESLNAQKEQCVALEVTMRTEQERQCGMASHVVLLKEKSDAEVGKLHACEELSGTLLAELRSHELVISERSRERDSLREGLERQRSLIALHEQQERRWTLQLAREELQYLSGMVLCRLSRTTSRATHSELAGKVENLSLLRAQREECETLRRTCEQERADALVALETIEQEIVHIDDMYHEAQEHVDILSQHVRSGQTDDDTEVFDLEQNDRELRRLERERAALGPVNPFAPEEAKALGERCQVLERSANELAGACDEIGALEKLLAGQCAAEFHATVDTVAATFAELYSELFPGGTALITLAETAVSDDDPEERIPGALQLRLPGIDLVAQPAGKRRQPLERLSGGEKALTSLAFLLALQQAQPSPFYVFDEVDASLDDSNVQRLVKLLARLAHERQFIVVTHNQLTMHAASVMYGVTVNRQGMSTVLRINLQQDVHSDESEDVTELVGTPQQHTVHSGSGA